MPANPTETLASFVASLGYEDLPAGLRQRVLQIILDSVASGIAGRLGEETAQIEQLARTVAGEGDATVLGAPHRLSLGGAALLNGYQVTAFNMCDVFRPARCHITPEVVPPALAIAEDRHVSGKALLTAVAAGLETTTRVGLALNPAAFAERGWHAPGVIGPFGGAAAVGSLLGLDEVSLRNAFGLAGAQSAGTMAHWGSPTIKFNQARASLSGLLAGLLASQGFRSGDNVLTDPTGGLLSSYSDGGRPEALTEALGDRWDLEAIALKRWTAGSGVQTLVTSLFALIEEHDVKPEGVKKLKVFLPTGAYRAHGEMAWDSKFNAQLSARYVAAVVLADRRCWMDQFETRRRQDPDVDAFARDRVEIEEDASLGPTATVVEVHTVGGAFHRDARSVPKGDPEDPIELDQIVQKLREGSEGILDEPTVDRLLEGLLGLEDLDDVAPLIALLGTADSSTAG